eukprot:CAMPEP_0170593852 /NCGR_PEP_ID=MMETSP0224-20130122/13683_1 /TAXON_ID=285029 /ORGANISM="Togula jolla, Strain CCCM 725" /LENGTH=444 /DNA_ID=CAMNT_0010917861 /DNA_START=135 /DNA_END=1469 /DNA_ORIENTATION=-
MALLIQLFNLLQLCLMVVAEEACVSGAQTIKTNSLLQQHHALHRGREYLLHQELQLHGTDPESWEAVHGSVHASFLDQALGNSSINSLAFNQTRASTNSTNSSSGTGVFHGEPLSPMAEEMRKHDRILVEGMFFMETLLREQADGLDAGKWDVNAGSWDFDSGKELCMVVITGNRKVRYIDASLSMLLRGNKPQKLHSTTDIHLLSVERRPKQVNYPHLYQELSKLTFLTIHNGSAVYSDRLGLEPDNERLRLADYTRDFLKALSICLDARSEFCLVMEDDAVPTFGLIEKLEAHVFPEMREHPEIPFVSLWSPTGAESDPFGAIDLRNYSLTRYFNAAGQFREGAVKYTVRQRAYPWGTVANVFSREGAEDFIGFIGKKDLASRWEAVDDYLNGPFLDGKERVEIQPSLVNHFGFYSERITSKNDANFVPFPTDIGFRLDDAS